MSKELERKFKELNNFKNTLTKEKNIELLLYLAKYNSDVTIISIKDSLGKDCIKGLKDLVKIDLVTKENGKLRLTDEGIFQMNGLVKMVC